MSNFIEQLNADVEELRALLAQCSTETVAGSVSSQLMRDINESDKDKEGEKLLSAAKQYSFLLSLLLSTPEKTDGKEFGKDEWLKSNALLNRIFSCYANLFWPSNEGIEQVDEEWLRVRSVAMPTFLHYFNTALLASIEQISDRIEKYCTAFDEELEKELGISATRALEISRYIQSHLQQHINTSSTLAIQEQKERFKILEEARKESKGASNFEEILQNKIKSPGYFEKWFAYFEAIKKIGLVEYATIKEKFPNDADAYWNIFTIKRGDAPLLKYPTENFIFESKPLILIKPEVAFCAYPNKLFEAILINCENTLKAEQYKSAFLLHRDKTLENEALLLFRKILGEDTQIYTSAFETANSHYEHDIVIVYNDKLLIVEVKASPPVEPFRDPDKAFTRIKRAFKSDSGIQSAFDQGVKIIRRLENGETVQLYDRKGNLLTTLEPNKLTTRYSACVTRDDFGYLATNLSLLLEKKESDSYPWVVSILELGFIVDAWQYCNLNANDFFAYLSERVRCHGKVYGSDELEFLGARLHHGSLNEFLISAQDVVFLDPSYSKFFDDLYYHLHHRASAPKINIVKPVMMDLRKSLENNDPTFVQRNEAGKPVGDKAKTGRNVSCFCGSGRKFKKCHGF